ncbi:MAG: ATPase domain-containing protein [Armatimonadota bacterium]
MQDDRLRTYIESVDDILHGGIPRYAVAVITGAPGSGKTVLTLQTIFNNAKRGAKCLYLTTLSEPATKLIRYTQRFEFFDESLVDNNVKFRDIGTALRTGGPQAAFDEIIRIVEEEQPDIVAIDSYKAIHDLSPDPEHARLFTYDLAAHLSAWSVTTFLVGEYTVEEVWTNPEFAVADAIIYMVHDLEGLRGLREIQVLKLRGSGFNAGRHFFEISPGGVEVYPRIGSVTEEEHVEMNVRIPSGIPGLDEMLHGGLIETSATLIEGATGIGKTLLGLHIMFQAAKQGDTGIIFTFEERPAQLRAIAKGFGIDLSEESGIRIVYTNPVELLAPKWLAEARELIHRSGAKRVMIDSLTSMRLGMLSESLFLDLLYTGVKMFRSMGITLIMTLEVPELFASSGFGPSGLSAMTDNIIIMRYVEVESSLKRAILVLKTRGTAHVEELREFTITNKGITVDGPFERFRGVLTGQAMPAHTNPEE